MIEEHLIPTVVGRVKVEKNTSDVFNTHDFTAELFDLRLVDPVYREVNQDLCMIGSLDISDYCIKGSASKPIVGGFQSVKTHKDAIGAGLDWKSSIRIQDDRAETNTSGIPDNILQLPILVLPEKRFSAFDEKRPDFHPAQNP